MFRNNIRRAGNRRRRRRREIFIILNTRQISYNRITNRDGVKQQR